MGMIPENKLDAAPEDRNSEDLLRSRTLRVTGVGTMEEPTEEDAPVVEYSVDNVHLGCVYDVLDSNNRWCEGEVCVLSLCLLCNGELFVYLCRSSKLTNAVDGSTSATSIGRANTTNGSIIWQYALLPSINIPILKVVD